MNAQKDKITPNKSFPYQGAFFQQKSKNSSQVMSKQAGNKGLNILEAMKAPRERSDSDELLKQMQNK